MKLTDTHRGQSWLSQFHQDDVLAAIDLLEQVVVISSSEFREWTYKAIENLSKTQYPLALYVEREFKAGSRFFNKIKTGAVKSAIGNSGPELIKGQRGSNHIGSEGIVSQITTELTRKNPKKFLLSPGPDRLRPKKTRGPIHNFVIVSDIIGSGDRIVKMLDALWRTETVRSWHSHRNITLNFYVISYASTTFGYEKVQSHHLKPDVRVERIAPTLSLYKSHAFYNQGLMESLCRRYDPRPSSEDPGPLGYKGLGTLLIFAHGCPNTTPRIFWKDGPKWRSMFQNRSASDMDLIFHKSNTANFSEKLRTLGDFQLCDQQIISQFPEEVREALLLLSAISNGINKATELASRTGLSMPSILSLLEAFSYAGWVDGQKKISPKGLAELQTARRLKISHNVVPPDAISLYFPQSLRRRGKHVRAARAHESDKQSEN